MSGIEITRAGPLATVQDEGRFGMLAHGISASGPMDRRAFAAAAAVLGQAGRAGIEFTAAGLAFAADGPVQMGCAGGQFRLAVNGVAEDWPARIGLAAGDVVEIMPGAVGNYGYLRFDREIELPTVLGSQSTNLTVGLGGFAGRGLRAGDRLGFGAPGAPVGPLPEPETADGPIRIIWGLHAELFDPALRAAFPRARFVVSPHLDRMGVRLGDIEGVFSGQRRLDLVSDAIIAGDIQILGDGTPVVLMRDHQPTGGYPRIATVASADFDRFAQMRPGSEIRFQPVSVEHAR